MAPVVGLAPTRTGLKDRALGSLHSRAFDEMAERGGHAPHHAKCATISLAKSPGLLVRFTFHWCPRQELHLHCPRFEVGASAIGYAGIEKKCSRSDSHRHCAGFKSAASALGYGS